MNTKILRTNRIEQRINDACIEYMTINKSTSGVIIKIIYK